MLDTSSFYIFFCFQNTLPKIFSRENYYKRISKLIFLPKINSNYYIPFISVLKYKILYISFSFQAKFLDSCRRGEISICARRHLGALPSPSDLPPHTTCHPFLQMLTSICNPLHSPYIPYAITV